MKKTITNEIRCTFLSKSENEALARSIISCFLIPLDPDVEELADIRCAVSEAVTNCIVHGYRESFGNIYIHVKLCEERTVKIEIKDKGCGISDIKMARQPLFTTDAESERSGMGFTVMENFMDGLRVRSKVDSGTTVVMVKKLSERQY